MESKLDLITGKHAVEDALARKINIEKVFLLKTIRGPYEKYIRELCKEENIPLSYVDKQKLDSITKSNHQGAIAFVTPIKYYKLESVIPHLFEQGKSPFILMLDHITDVRNIGAIARSAEVFGVDAIVVPMDRTAMLNDFAIKSSAGALLSITVCREKSLVNSIGYLKNSGFGIYGMDGAGKEMIQAIQSKDPFALVMGAEDVGMGKAIVELCDDVYKIPQVGQTESLNVSVATGIALYECMKNRL